MIITILIISWLACVVFMLFAGSPLTEPSDVVIMIFIGTVIWFAACSIASVFIPIEILGLA